MTDATPAWDDERDVVVIGSGAAGLTAAAVAAAEGRNVLVLEKADVVGGTTAVSGGGLWIPCNPHMSDVGVDDSRDEALEYMRACAAHDADDDLVVALVDNGAPMITYLEERVGLTFRAWPAVGGTIDYRPWLPGSRPGGRALTSYRFEKADLGEWGDKVRLGVQSSWTMDPLDYYRKRVHLMPASDSTPRRQRDPDAPVEAFASGGALVAQLLRGCLAKGVEVRPGIPVARLLVEQGRVVGVETMPEAGSRRIRARHGVMMATGGFGTNEELKRRWMTRPLEYTCDVESNQGDGHLMGMEIGAQVSGLGDAWWMPQLALGATPEGMVNAAGTREDRILPHTVIVNDRGKRFVNEALNYYDFGEAFGQRSGATPRNWPAWFVFDQQGVDRYALLSWKVPAGTTPDWLVVADSIADLANQIRVPAETLEATVDRFNGFARSGLDEDFGRGESEWDRAWGDPSQEPNPCLGTLEKAPFYAMRLHSGALATRGGLRIDGRARVLSVRGEVIPGLYAAGNCSNGAVPGTYQGPGSTIGAAMTFAYLAGLELAR